jgi:hypothetical protein
VVLGKKEGSRVGNNHLLQFISVVVIGGGTDASDGNSHFSLSSVVTSDTNNITLLGFFGSSIVDSRCVCLQGVE